MKNILVTGGCGFIGSHTCLSLLMQNFSLIVIDSNINSSQIVLQKIIEIGLQINKDFSNKIHFFKGNIKDEILLNKIFEDKLKSKNVIEAVIHFAGLKSVEQSTRNPILYWENNVCALLPLLRVMQKYNCKTIIFSSSATVYKMNSGGKLYENSELMPRNPYGETKLAIEKILSELFLSKSGKFRIANLRYFNPIGAHESGLIGEDPLNIPNNLFPFICKVAAGSLDKLRIFGSNWPTRDGTCIRDFIHVMDLAEAHISTLQFLLDNDPQIINLNIGTGIGTSVMELVNTFINVNKCDVPYVFALRRDGDVPTVIADNKLALSTLNWKPNRSIKDMCRDGWNWQKKNPKGFQI